MRAIYWWFGFGVVGYLLSIVLLLMGLFRGLDGEFAHGAYLFLLSMMGERSGDTFMKRAEELQRLETASTKIA